MIRRGRAMVLAGTGAAAAGVVALSSYLLIAGGGEPVEARDLRVRITEASVERGQERTVVTIVCELGNKTGKMVFLGHESLEDALRSRLRFRLDNSQPEWSVGERFASRHTMWGVPEVPLLKPEERKTVAVVTSSAHHELRAEDGTVMAVPDLFAHGGAVHARILGAARAFTGDAHDKGQTVEVESASVAVAVTGGKN